MSRGFDAQTTVRDIVVRFPQARAALESQGIDYCCGGKHSLAEAAREAGLDLDTVLAAIDQAITRAASQPGRPQADWDQTSLTVLADHILNAHHVFMHRALPRAADLLGKVLRAHGRNHGEMLSHLHGVYDALRRELEAHLAKEEQILFPYIKEMERQVAAGGAVPPMHCGSIQNPIRQMEMEHERAGEALGELREITGDYTLPGDACPTFAALYDLLTRIEADLHEHIHLENNILFPRAVEMAGDETSCQRA